jgi:putative transposase
MSEGPRPGRSRLLPPYNLDHLLIFERRHLETVLAEFVEHYHEARPHQGLGQRRPGQPPTLIVSPHDDVERRDRLGGSLHDYRRVA